MTYTNEQIEAMASGCDQCGDPAVGEMLRAWIAERQAARDGVTAEMVETASRAYTDVCYGFGQPNALGKKAMRAALQSVARPTAPIDMILHCPICHVQHIDETEHHRVIYDGDGSPIDVKPSWNNPPHRSHLCHACGTVWRPADVPTNGVKEIKTKGKGDKFVAQPQPQQAVPDGWKLVPNDLSVAMLEAGKTAHFMAEEDCREELNEDCLPHASPESMRWRKNRVERIWSAMLSAAPAYNGKKDET